MQTNKYNVDEELVSTQRIWSQKNIYALSGLYIHINLFPIDEIMQIISQHSSRFETPENIIITLDKTNQFIHAITGHSKDNALQGGIKNPLVKNWLIERMSFHKNFLGLQHCWMMEYVAKIITEAPIRLASSSFSEKETTDYYNYMKQAWKIMGIDLHFIVKTESGIIVEESASTSVLAKKRIEILRLSYERIYGEPATRQMFEKNKKVISPSLLKSIF